MSGAAAKPSPAPSPEAVEPQILAEEDLTVARARQARVLRLLWDRRRMLFRAGLAGLAVSTLVAFLIPKSYTSTAQLMPPDSQSTSSMAMTMMAAMATKTGGGLTGVAGDLLGLKSSGALFVGVLRSETSQDRIIKQFDLQKVYRTRLLVDARKKLDENTAISEDRKSGIISISATDHNPERAATIANAYVDELNELVAQLSTSAAHRERVFLEERLRVVKRDLDDASNQLAQYSSKKGTLDIQTEGRAMLEAASRVAGELIAAQSALEGLRQIYTDSNSRVKSMSARVAELRKQLEKLGGTEPSSERTPPNEVSSADPPPGQLSNVTGHGADPPDGNAGSLPFPTIRELPLVGAKWSDYYRHAKIQETVFELLTEQYELAKVQEAKETPSVKVLDPGRVPERKSWPPRLLIMVLGTFLVSACCVVWILGAWNWEETASSDPRKVLAQEVVAALRASTGWTSHNGDASSSRFERIWSRLGSRKPPTDGPEARQH